MAAWPWLSASCNAVSPSWSRSSVLAPTFSSSCTHSLLPWLAATIRAVSPSPFCRSMPALRSRNRRTMARWPIPAARMRAVVSVAPRRSMLAPRCSSSFATPRCPLAAAMCSIPTPSSSSTSTCPPCCSHSTICCSSPLLAAAMTSFGSNSHDARAAGLAEGGAVEASCKFVGLSSTASASPPTATSYRPLAALKCPATPHRPLSSGRALRPSIRTRRPERLGVGAATVAGGLVACCRSSLAMAA
eukprot:scaffold21068_cov66-Phaeocystis_antarctica.AAC.9